MPAAEPHAHDHEKMREAILGAARALVVREGCASVSMRRVAERVGCSAASIYNYFPDKADLLLALAEDGFRRFARVMAEPLPDLSPLAALEAHFWRRYQFSKRYPEYFWLMFVDRAIARGRDGEDFEAMRQARRDATTLLHRCLEDGSLPAGTDAGEAYRVLATSVLGAAVRRLSGGVSSRRQSDGLARDILRTAIAGLGGRPPSRGIDAIGPPGNGLPPSGRSPEPPTGGS